MEPFCGKVFVPVRRLLRFRSEFLEGKKKKKQDKLSLLFLKVDGCLVLRHSLEETGKRGSNPTDPVSVSFWASYAKLNIVRQGKRESILTGLCLFVPVWLFFFRKLLISS